MTKVVPLPANPLAATDAMSRAVYTWAESTTGDTPRRDDLIRDKTRDLERFFNWLNKPIAAITPVDVDAWRAHLEREGKAANTVYSMISRISSFWQWATKDKHLRQAMPANPVVLARPTAPRPYDTDSAKSLSDEQITTLLTYVGRLAAEDDLSAKRDHAMLLFYFLTGLRREEVVQLRWGNVTLTDTGIVFATRIKGGQRLNVELNDLDAKRALIGYIRGRWNNLQANSPLWVRHDRGAKPDQAVTSHGFVKNLKRYAQACGLGHIHLHQTRHSFARIVADETKSLNDTQEALNHQNAATTRVYVQRIGTKRDHHSAQIAKRIKAK